MDTVLIRQAEVDDAAALITYLREVTSDPHVNLLYDPGEFCLTVEQERAFILQRRDGSRGLLLVAEADGCIIGVAGADRKPCRAEQHVVVLGLSVLAAYRAPGLAVRLDADARWGMQTIFPTAVRRSAQDRHRWNVVGSTWREEKFPRGWYYDFGVSTPHLCADCLVARKAWKARKEKE